MINARRDDIVDDYHGTKVEDPYRWLEDPDSEETKKWVETENKLTEGYLKNSDKEKIKKKLEKLWNYDKYSTPIKRNNRYFFSKMEGLQNQPVYYVMEGLDGEPKTIIDPNELSEDGTVAVVNISPSKDGKLLGYSVSSSGSDWQELRVRDVESGKDYEDKVKWCKFTLISWKPDGSGFYYSRFPEPGSVDPQDQFNYNKVYFHKIGTKQEEDKLIYENPDDKELGFVPFVTYDGKYLCLYVYHGTDNENRFYIKELDSDADFTKLLDKADAEYDFIGSIGSKIYFNTNLDAPKYRIIAIDINNPEKDKWEEIISQNDKDIIEAGAIVNNQLLISYLHNAYRIIKMFSLKGEFNKELELPTMGSVLGYGSEGQEDYELFFMFSSFLYPSEVFRYDFNEEKLESFFKPELDFNASDYETKQVFYTSKDGTKVPMFIVHKKDIKLDGNNPTMLYGYGGFDISLTPVFSSRILTWLELGGIYVTANLRGGGEFGEEWHKAGMLEKKQNVFDDFISAGEWLIENKYTRKEKLAIMGGSNGGLLVAACLVQRPDLYGAIVCRVPVIDMLRFHKFTIGRYWTGEFGNAEKNPEHFKFLYAYSPLHNVRAGEKYPATLITSADTDDRVVPAHAKKFAATLQRANTSNNPILIRIETKAGHGMGKPTAKVIEEESDIFAFVLKEFEKADKK